jgi:hypothetical protein
MAATEPQPSFIERLFAETNSTIGQCPQVPGPPGPGPDTGGLTARISKIGPSGKVTTVASGFPSVSIGPGGANGTIGVADVVFWTPTVIVIFANPLASRFFGVEGETIVERDGCDLSCHSEHQGGIVGESARGKIDVSRRATSIERRE